MKLKHRFLAMFMASIFLLSSLTVFASEESSSATTESTETASEVSSETSTDDISAETATDTYDEEEESTFSAIQSSDDYGCVIEKTEESGLSLEAGAAILIEAETGKVLYSRNADEKMYPASITKVLTTLVALENGNLNDEVTFSAETLNAVEQGSSRIGVEAGETCTLEDALHCVMLASGNDTAAGVAEHIAGSVDAFVEMMNAKAEELGCTGSHFTNPHGLPDENHYTTASDMAKIVRAAVHNDQFASIASDLSYNMPATNKCDAREIWQHHKMMYPAGQYYYEDVIWGKTGYTTVALNTLVTVAKRDDLTLIAVVLKCPGASYTYTNSAQLFDYGFDNYTVLKPLENFSLKEAAASSGVSEDAISSLEKLDVLFNSEYAVVAPNTVSVSDIQVSVSTDNATDGIWGSLIFTYNNNEIGRANVYYDADAQLNSILEEDGTLKATAAAKIPFILVVVIVVLLLFIIFQLFSMIFRRRR